MAEVIERLPYFISELYNFVNDVYNKGLNLSLSYLSADDFKDLLFVEQNNEALCQAFLFVPV